MPNTERQEFHYRKGEKINQQLIVLQAPLFGGMGEVYKCREEYSGSIVAVKMLRNDRHPTKATHDSLRREAANWLELGKQKNIVRFISVLRSDSLLALVAEWIEPDDRGRTSLVDWLRHGPLPLRLALDFAMDICRGLLHAQQKVPDIVHRDLKPSNVLLGWTEFFQGLPTCTSSDPYPILKAAHDRREIAQAIGGSKPVLVREQVAKINDWGLANVADEAERRGVWPRPSNRVGTWLYMAPEQWHGWHSDSRTDIYAIGCILFEMLTGMPPYPGTARDALMESHTRGQIPRLPQSIPHRNYFQGVLTACLAKNPADRYDHVRHLLDDLAQVYDAEFAAKPRALESDMVFYTETDQVNRGLAYVTLEQYERALACFKEALRMNADSSHAYAGCALVHLSQSNYREALAALDKAIQINPNSARFYTNRGSANRHLGRSAAALEDFAKAIELAPDDSISFTNRGNLYSAIDEYDEAVRDFTEAIRLSPKEAQNYHNRGVVYSRRGEHQLAIQDLTSAIRYEPTNSSHYCKRADIFADLGRYQNAVEDCTAAIDCDPNYAPAFRLRAFAYTKLHATEKARKDEMAARGLESAGNSAPEGHERGTGAFENCMAQARALADRGDHEQAIELLTQAIGLRPDVLDAYFRRAASLAEVREHQRAIVDISRVLDSDPRWMHGHYARGVCHLELGNLASALEDFSVAIEQQPSDVDCYFARAMCYDQLGRLEESESDYTKAIRCEPDNPRAYHNRATVRQRMGHEDAAHADFVAAYRRDPQDPDYCVGVGSIYYNRGQFQAAAPYFEQAFWLGDERAAAVALQLREQLGYKPAERKDPIRVSFESFLNASSQEDMRRAVLRCPFMSTQTFLKLIQDRAAERDRLKDDITPRLEWLRNVLGVQKLSGHK